ncbi:MAG: chromate efflux transporter [Vicinamibacteria bacterium]|nr:chromate efflux transporter [Vicinamibacteria bacterium]
MSSHHADALREVALLFLRLGTTAFGGPVAHIAMMEDEVVRRRGWVSREEFLDLLGATNLIPGPNSTELAIHLGHRRAGWTGLVVAGIAFVLPATLIVWALAWAYVEFGQRPAAVGLLLGVKPVILAIIAQALWGLGRTALKNGTLALVAALSALASVLGVNELVVLFAAGAGLALTRISAGGGDRGGLAAALPLPALALLGAATPTAFSLPALFLSFVKIGSVLFGSGYVLLAFLRAEFVVRLGWLSESQLLDAVALGQVTPGPLSTTATFVGFVTGGHAGAVVATLGMFLPAFFFVAISGPLVPRLRRSPLAGAFLDGVNAASLALMAVVTAQLARDAVFDLPTAVVAALSALLLLRYRVNSTWLVLAGAAFGLLYSSQAGSGSASSG